MEFALHAGWSLGGYLPLSLPPEMAAALPFPSAFSNEDEKWMFVALIEGMKGAGIANPNPSVGCVIVKDGKLLAAGATEAFRRRHAERVAFEKLPAGSDLQGCTVYVSLEPCTHQGNQPPCVDLLIEKKVTRVVIACGDPNPKVSGAGIAKLRTNHVDVEVGTLSGEALMWHLPFLYAQAHGRSLFIGKWAETPQGLLADDSGESKWITGPVSRSYGHWLRQKYDAIVLGAGSVVKDLPHLTVRDCRKPIQRQPLRIIVDLRGRITEITPPLRAATFSDDAKTVLLIAQSNTPPKNIPSSVCVVPTLVGDPAKAVAAWVAGDEATQYFGKPIQSIYVEGGASLLKAFFENNLLDALHVFTGTKELSGNRHQVNFQESKQQFQCMSEMTILEDSLREYVKKDVLRLLLSRKY